MVNSQDNMERFIFTQPPLDKLSIVVYFAACFPMSLLSTVWEEHLLTRRKPGELDWSFLVCPVSSRTKPLTPGCESVLFETKGQVGIEEINLCQEPSGSKSREHVDGRTVG